MLDAPRLGQFGEFDAGADVDLFGHLLELLPHRVVRDSGEMHDRVQAVEEIGRELPQVAEILGL